MCYGTICTPGPAPGFLINRGFWALALAARTKLVWALPRERAGAEAHKFSFAGREAELKNCGVVELWPGVETNGGRGAGEGGRGGGVIPKHISWEFTSPEPPRSIFPGNLLRTKPPTNVGVCHP